MQKSVETGLDTEGILYGGIGTVRKAKYLFRQKHIDETEETKTNRSSLHLRYCANDSLQ